MIHPGNLTISDAAQCAALVNVTSVGDWLFIRAAGVQLPTLTTVGEGLSIEAAGVQLPALTTVGGWLSIRAADVQLPALTTVGGRLSIRAAGVQLPALGEVIAYDSHSHWGLLRTHSGMYRAGCRGPWTAQQALAHWGAREDARALLFAAAIRRAEKGE